MNDAENFDHHEHIRRLEDAMRELQVLDKPLLAAAVGRAISLHCDAQGRISHAQLTERRLKGLQAKLGEVMNDMKDYVTKPGPPWLVPRGDVYPKSE